MSGDPLALAGNEPLNEGRSRQKIKPAPTTFFDILVEKDVQKRGQKIAAAAQASLNMDDSVEEPVSPAPSDVILDPSAHVMADLPIFLQRLAGDVYLDRSSVRIVKRLGEGGFAVVHKAELRGSAGTGIVAIKALKPGIIEDDEDMKELIQEANLLRKMEHKNIVHFCGVGSTETDTVTAMRESVFFAEEFMGGGTLKHLITEQMKKKLPRKYRMVEALRWCTNIAEALLYLHHCEPVVVHRDLKPENVLLSKADTRHAQAKIADFGLHKRLTKINKRLHLNHAFNDLSDMGHCKEDLHPKEQGSGPQDHGSGGIHLTMSGRIAGAVRRFSRKSLGSPEDSAEITSGIEKSGGVKLGDSQQHGSFTALEMLDSGANSADLWKGRKAKKDPKKGRLKPTGSKLGNIGSVAGSTVSGMVGSLMYMAPEVVRGDKYDEKVDVFGFGVIMYELFRMELTIYRLLSGCTTAGEMEVKMQRYAQSVSRGHREVIPADWPPAVRDLIQKSWCHDPKQRPSMGLVLKKLAKITSSREVEEMDMRIDAELTVDQRSTKCQCCVVS